MQRRLEDLKLLNMDRWRAHLQNCAERDHEAAEERKSAAQHPVEEAVAALVPVPELATERTRVPPAALAVPTPVPTANELFKRPNPLQRGHSVRPYGTLTSPHDYGRVSTLSTDAGWRRPRHQVVPVLGDDAASRTRLITHSKQHVPVTSVTRKQGDCKLFLCCGWRWTAAQWIWALNFVCFLAHTTMIFVTYHFAYWRHDLDPAEQTKHVLIPIYRIRNIPTQHMLDTNQSHWSKGWNLTSTNPNSGLFLYDNGMPINLASLVAAFFATSAVFHFFACVVGAFERLWSWYWQKMDDALLWWRWLEYSVSAALMAIALGIVLGIREQNTLASLFMLTWATQTYGFLTEYLARPKAYVDRESSEHVTLALLSQTEWSSGRPLYDAKNPQQPIDVEPAPRACAAGGWGDWARRLVPHIFGWFTMTTVWVILVVQLEHAKSDIDEISDSNIPEWVNALIYGSFAIFTQFAFVQIVFQRLGPGLYWATEIAYCILSLTAKLYLGLLILVNVIMADASANDTLSGAGANAQR
tara:strand:- start:2228 stop:3808 length:1581 start_codon:yes stop_codon:yes gene_type:complete